jgi:hypothetical protein
VDMEQGRPLTRRIPNHFEEVGMKDKAKVKRKEETGTWFDILCFMESNYVVSRGRVLMAGELSPSGIVVLYRHQVSFPPGNQTFPPHLPYLTQGNVMFRLPLKNCKQ